VGGQASKFQSFKASSFKASKLEKEWELSFKASKLESVKASKSFQA